MSLEDITNFIEISGQLGSAGQPTRAQFSEVQVAGYQVVINLAMPDSPGAIADESSLVRGLGLEYIHIPVVWTAPHDQDLDAFMETMRQARGKKVFAHCALNMRVSSFIYIYRVVVLGAVADEAWWDVLSVWQPDETWQNFIDQAMNRFGKSVKIQV